MISISVNARGQYRYGLPLTEERVIGTCVQLGNWMQTTQPTWLAVSHAYSRRRVRHERIYECDIEPGDRCMLIEPYSPNEIALVRFNTFAGLHNPRIGFTQKYWGIPEKVERALTLHENVRGDWEDAVYVMNPGDTVFVHPTDRYIPPYVIRWNGDSLEKIRVGTFNQYVVQPWLQQASADDIRAALSNAKRRRHKSLTMLLSEIAPTA
ncbi:MAG: hypothetical protein RI947_625 [Candidatus Parcubacteria bacterium]|jgi:hypothetical protein